jgi:hypothetical protein
MILLVEKMFCNLLLLSIVLVVMMGVSIDLGREVKIRHCKKWSNFFLKYWQESNFLK